MISLGNKKFFIRISVSLIILLFFVSLFNFPIKTKAFSPDIFKCSDSGYQLCPDFQNLSFDPSTGKLTGTVVSENGQGTSYPFSFTYETIRWDDKYDFEFAFKLDGADSQNLILVLYVPTPFAGLIDDEEVRVIGMGYTSGTDFTWIEDYERNAKFSHGNVNGSKGSQAFDNDLQKLKEDSPTEYKEILEFLSNIKESTETVEKTYNFNATITHDGTAQINGDKECSFYLYYQSDSGLEWPAEATSTDYKIILNQQDKAWSLDKSQYQIKENVRVGEKVIIKTYFVVVDNNEDFKCLKDEPGRPSVFDPVQLSKYWLAGRSGDLYEGTSEEELIVADDGTTTINLTKPVNIRFKEKVSSGGVIQNALQEAISWLVNQLIKAVNLTAKASIAVLDKGNNFDSPAMQDLWKVSRNIAMSFLVLIIIIIALANVVQNNLDKYNIGRMVPRIFVSMALVYISYLYVQFLVSLASALQNAIAGDITVLQNVQAATNGTWGAGDAANALAQVFLLIILLVFIFIVMIYLVLILIARIVVIWFLAAIAPMAFLCRILPFSEGLYLKRRDTLVKWVMIGPLLVYMLFFTSAVLKAYNASFNIVDADFSSSDSYIFLIMVAICIFLSATLPVSIGGRIMASVAGRVKGYGKSISRPISKQVQRKTGIEGAKAFLASRRATIDRRAARKYEKRFAETGTGNRLQGWAAGQGLVRRDKQAIANARRQYSGAVYEEAKNLTPAERIAALNGDVLHDAGYLRAMAEKKELNPAKLTPAGLNSWLKLMDENNPNFDDSIFVSSFKENTNDVMDYVAGMSANDLNDPKNAALKRIFTKIRSNAAPSDLTRGDLRARAAHSPSQLADLFGNDAKLDSFVRGGEDRALVEGGFLMAQDSLQSTPSFFTNSQSQRSLVEQASRRITDPADQSLFKSIMASQGTHLSARTASSASIKLSPTAFSRTDHTKARDSHTKAADAHRLAAQEAQALAQKYNAAGNTAAETQATAIAQLHSQAEAIHTSLATDHGILSTNPNLGTGQSLNVQPQLTNLDGIINNINNASSNINTTNEAAITQIKQKI